jgi:hypothetical protein
MSQTSPSNIYIYILIQTILVSNNAINGSISLSVFLFVYT